MTVSELLNTESKWGQGLMRKEGKMCILDAIFVAYPGESEYNRVKNRVKKYLRCDNIVGWNDSSQRTFADVRQVIEALNI